ncbi:type III-B CRISPR-associated protein Cas10/Cmr2 [Geobacillus sp. FSL W8-0032]|uniref:type III-B CRISPR-associated protein Cas10/Cmr2 n=1 Tax=unclassified Geobacillus TaxID=2642459 RepID=UPI0030DB0F6D
MTNRYIVLFTVGPVQSFIASARKTEDFWSGSYILSHLVREAMKRFYQYSAGCEMIYPLVGKEELRALSLRELRVASLPNRLTAVMEGTEADICGWLQETEQGVRNVFLDFCFQAVSRMFPHLSDDERQQLEAIVEQQVQSFLEVYWVAEPYEPSASFRTVRERAERRLGALKNEKHYASVPQQGLVCSVCKEREALRLEEIDDFDRYGEIKRKTANLWRRRAGKFQGRDGDGEDERRVGRVKDNELLCGICLGKRVARDYFTDLFGAAFRPFPSVLDIGSGDYYAVLMMDGDNMGRWFSGEQKEEYSRTSQKLARFSKEVVPRIVEQQCHGELVYAGGDDVLAFLPVDEALKAAELLRLAFSDEQQGLGEGATASFGLVIAHKKAPLQHVLNEARMLEQKAKQYRNEQTNQQKDALALAVHTRSGEIAEAILPWMIKGKMASSRLEQFVDLVKTSISPNFIFHFTQAFAPLLHDKDCPKWENRDMLAIELRRLLKRSVKEGSQWKERDLRSHTDALMALYDAVPSGYDFLHLLKMLTFFRRSEGSDV